MQKPKYNLGYVSNQPKLYDGYRKTQISDDEGLEAMVRFQLYGKKYPAVRILVDVEKTEEPSKQGILVHRQETHKLSARPVPISSASARQEGSSGHISRPKRNQSGSLSCDVIDLTKDEHGPTPPSTPQKHKKGGDDTDSETEKKRQQREEKEEREQQSYELWARSRDAIIKAKGKAMERCTLDEWETAGDFFGLEKGTLRKGEPIKLHSGWDISGSWFPYQLVEVYQLYMMELSDRNGFIYGNMMGLGKTRSSLGIILVGYIHLLMWLDRIDNPSQHIRFDASELGATLECPSQSKFPFTCFCNPNSHIYKKEPRIAPTLVSGSGKSSDAWKDEVLAMGLLKSKWCNPNQPFALRVCAMDKKAIFGLDELSKSEWVEMRVRIDAQNALDTRNSRVRPQEYVYNKQKYSETVYWDIQSPIENHPRATLERPSPTSGRFILICGEHSLKTRILDMCRVFVEVQRDTHYKKGIRHETERIQADAYSVIWGRTIFDEFHNSKSEDTQFAQLYKRMRITNRGYQWKSWAISGTPMENGLREMLIFITLALRGVENDHGVSNWKKQIKQNGDLELVSKNYVYDLIEKTVTANSKQYLNGIHMSNRWRKISEKAAKTNAEEAMKVDDYNQLLDDGAQVISHFMLRRTLQTRDPWGKSITILPGMFEVKVRPCNSGNWSRTIEEMVNHYLPGKKPSDIFSRSDMIAIGTYPGLAAYKAELVAADYENNYHCLHSEALQSQFCNLETAPFKDELDNLIRGSTKLQQITEICQEVMNSQRPNPKYSRNAITSNEPQNLPAKILIMTYKPITSLVTYFALSRQFKQDNVLLLPGSLDRNTLKERLDKWKDPTGPRIMVLSMSFAEAITLTEANYIVIMEPQDRQAKQEQALFRIYRIGQLAKVCYGFILFNPESEIEVGILNRQRFKTMSRDMITEAEKRKMVTSAQIDWENTVDDVPYEIDGLTC
ncbi:hypothetical protein COCC4DRAFT_143603 [Bipolaris maydis ATCC 48331]|uniref:Helicase C-terminal domain-containing protein n=2 Tax=Cochliobolus heterostrophus TaxID=5016 RepID=M2TY48_COCH5|nr:uncharacterized protein COCC4DRAFT_143603 [Bipolaris maydis ATCC 48331]EMD86701.1 hypothetical protein COCHEDRAFT_22837 [Bipolaris maydis C5]ENI03096.1 hypothetical protein COCC4DRAFT_143603 [Bipolaris maydis ATCC 48331]KAJ6267386.1 hypothetical protein PSV08DRAFT_373534 [Bipolaris maydis]KAJ6267661.1 hypothetical protein PSV08DRAFT_373739 [Bipolaris maydis]